MATHSSVLAWRIPGTAEPGGLPSVGSHRVRRDWSDLEAAAADYSNWGKFSLSMAFTTLEAFSVLVPPPVLKKTTNTSRNLKFSAAQGIEVESICHSSVAQAPVLGPCPRRPDSSLWVIFSTNQAVLRGHWMVRCRLMMKFTHSVLSNSLWCYGR